MPNLHMSIECAEPVNLLIIITIQDTKFVIFLISGYGPGCDIKTPVNSAKHKSIMFEEKTFVAEDYCCLS